MVRLLDFTGRSVKSAQIVKVDLRLSEIDTITLINVTGNIII